MRQCRFCHRDIQDTSRVCEHCGKDLFPEREAPLPPAPSAAARLLDPLVSVAGGPLTRVSVVDVDLQFTSMVGFMVK